MFFEAASSRRTVIASSRATISTTSQAGIQFSPTKAMKAEQTIILSASGSIRIPKFVMSLLRRAIWPSRKSVMPPATKSARAIVSRNDTARGKNITTRKATVRMNREIVSLLGRFIQVPGLERVRKMVAAEVTRRISRLARETVRLVTSAATWFGNFSDTLLGVGRSVTFQFATVLTRTRSLANWQLDALHAGSAIKS